MSVDPTPVRVAAGRYDVSLMRHWAARLGEEGLRSGDVWFLVGMPAGGGAFLDAAILELRRGERRHRLADRGSTVTRRRGSSFGSRVPRSFGPDSKTTSRYSRPPRLGAGTRRI
jgi:hypothetical protein